MQQDKGVSGGRGLGSYHGYTVSEGEHRSTFFTNTDVIEDAENQDTFRFIVCSKGGERH